MIKIIIIPFFALLTTLTFSQKNVFITLSPKVANTDLLIGADLMNLNGIVFNLDYFDYYLSGLHIIHDGGQDLDLSDTVFIVEPNNYVLYLGFLNVTNIEQMNFAVGVPPNLNTQDGVDAFDISTYPLGHPLSFQDPSMYWGWTTGYSHAIIGGLADSNTDGIPDAVFEIHNIANENYLPIQLPVIQTSTSASQIDVFVNCNVDVWLKDIAIETVGILHGSHNENAEMMLNIITEPVFNQSATAAILNTSDYVGTLSFITENSALTISWKNSINVDHFELIDISGKKVKSGTVSDENGNLVFNNLSNGVYHFKFFDKYSTLLNRIKVVI